MAFGEQLKEIRLQTGMSQADVAKKMGITKQAYNKYEHLELPPKPSTLSRIADALGMSETDRMLRFYDYGYADRVTSLSDPVKRFQSMLPDGYSFSEYRIGNTRTFRVDYPDGKHCYFTRNAIKKMLEATDAFFEAQLKFRREVIDRLRTDPGDIPISSS